MLRYTAALLLPAALFLAGPPAVKGDPWTLGPAYATQIVNELPGTYENVSGGGTCYVYGRPRSFLFVNENGSQAWFVYSGPNQLRMVRGDWDPNIVVTVRRDAYGRTTLRFDAPNTPTGYWVRVA